MTVKYSIKQYQVKKFISDNSFLSLNGVSYFQKVARFLHNFMEDFLLIPKSKNIWIGVSGGQDSMALLTCCVLLKRYGILKNICVIHVDHGSRIDGRKDFQLIKEVCDKLGVKCYLKQIKIDFSIPDYENIARINRYEVFNKILTKGELLYTAHNINDSYEWSLMQSSRSSQWSSSLGVPVINNNIARPFNCLTRKQIEKLNSLLEIPYINDLSNKNIRFERNYCRAKIVPLIEDKYPKMLKHYVHRSNEMARILGLLRHKGSDRSQDSYKVIKNSSDITLVIDLKLEGNFTGFRSELINIIKHHSSKNKGKISTQLNSLLSAASSGMKGPMSFSGGVICHIEKGILYFSNIKNSKLIFEQLDLEILKKLKSGETTEITGRDDLLGIIQSKYSFPLLIFSKSRNIPLDSIKKVNSLLPRSTEFALGHNIWFQVATRVYLNTKQYRDNNNNNIYFYTQN